LKSNAITEVRLSSSEKSKKKTPGMNAASPYQGEKGKIALQMRLLVVTTKGERGRT